MPRVAIFVDGGHLNHVLRKSFDSARIDFARLSEKFAHNDEILRTYYYDCEPYQSRPPIQEEKALLARRQKFHSHLSGLPRYEVRLGRLIRYRAGGEWRFLQKGVDVQLAVDLVRAAVEHQIGRAVLVTGDTDFIPAIQMAKDHGVVVSLWYSGRVNNELWHACDERFRISKEMIKSLARR